MKPLYVRALPLYMFLTKLRIFVHWLSFDPAGCERIVREHLPWREDRARHRTGLRFARLLKELEKISK